MLSYEQMSRARETYSPEERAELSKLSHHKLLTISQGLNANEIFRNWWTAKLFSEAPAGSSDQISVYKCNYFEQDENFGYYVQPTRSTGPHVYWALEIDKFDLHRQNDMGRKLTVASVHIGTDYFEDETQGVKKYNGGFVTVDVEGRRLIDSDEGYEKVNEHFGDIFLPKRSNSLLRRIFPSP